MPLLEFTQRARLTRAETAEARRLTALCDEAERLEMPVNLQPAPTGAPAQFLAHQDGSLAGLLSLQRNGEIEVCLMVHPRRRRRRLGRALLEFAARECASGDMTSWLLVCEEASKSGKAFVRAVGGRYRHSEYRMQFDEGSTSHVRPDPTVAELAKAGSRDLPALTRIIAASFGHDETQERPRIARDLRRPTHRFFLGRHDGKPVGSLAIVKLEGRAYIIAFGVLPEYRGRGIGRAMLASAVNLLRTERQRRIMIEVATDNRSALGLYRSCGFSEQRTYHFYEVPL